MLLSVAAMMVAASSCGNKAKNAESEPADELVSFELVGDTTKACCDSTKACADSTKACCDSTKAE